MHVAVRVYHDGPAYIAATKRIETLLLPLLERMPGFVALTMLRFCDPTNGASCGFCAVEFRTGEQLTEAVRMGTRWSQHHLADLQVAFWPTELFPAEVLLSAGKFIVG
jgi:hypothetical protein